MSAKKKPNLAIVIGVGKGKKAPPDSEPKELDEEEKGEGEDTDDDDQAHTDAMEEFQSALESKDTPRAVEAFKVLYDLCSSEHGGGEYDEE